MKYFLILLFLMFPVAAKAEELYSPKPYCADIKNDTDAKTFVAIRTDFYTKPDGTRSYYEQVMHLEPGKSEQVCAKGPFFPDYKVTLMIKSFVPLFECKTKLQGTITVSSKPTASGGNDYSATCVN